jgi:hypothetical protein
MKSSIRSFWRWFESISMALFENVNDPDILRELDQKIKVLGPFDWEIGSIEKNVLYLAISPNLNEDLLRETTEIVGYAPLCEGWLFLHVKPRKEYLPTFTVFNEKQKRISIDIGSWSYVLFKFEDGTFDIDIKINSIDGNSETQKLAIDIALTNLLGEERFINCIKNINIVNEFEENENKTTQLRYINEHLDKLLK